MLARGSRSGTKHILHATLDGGLIAVGAVRDRVSATQGGFAAEQGNELRNLIGKTHGRTKVIPVTGSSRSFRMRRAGTNKLHRRQVCGIAARRGQIRLGDSLGALQGSRCRCGCSVPAQKDGIRSGNKPAVENTAARPAAHSEDPEPSIDGGRGKAFPDVCGAVILPANTEIEREVPG